MERCSQNWGRSVDAEILIYEKRSRTEAIESTPPDKLTEVGKRVSDNQFLRHRKARAKLNHIYEQSEKITIIHYSCESFYDLPDGRSPRITSIAVRNLETGQTDSFSIHQMAELRRIPMTQADIEPYYNDLEKEMLEAFYTYVKANPEKTYIHWNMRDKNFGFQAIEHRFRVLQGNPINIPDDRKIDLSGLFIKMYGVGYIGHPRLESLLEKNNISARDFMTGKEEADAFVAGRYVDLHRSTLRKVDVFSNLAGRAYDDKLKSLSSWRESRGYSLASVVEMIKSHPIITGIIILGGLASAVFSFVKLLGLFDGP